GAVGSSHGPLPGQDHRQVGVAGLRGHVDAASGRRHLTSSTLFEKVWRLHEVVPETRDTPAVLYIDLHLTHEVTTPQAFDVLRERGWPVRRPDLTLATMDHSTPTRTEQVFGGAPIS